MKKVASLILICMIAAFVVAAESEKQGQGASKKTASELKDVSSQDVRPRATRRGQPRNRQQMYEQMLARRAETHAKGIAELEAIKKIAEEEKAVKTVAAIEALITKKNTQYKESMAMAERQRKQREEQLQQRSKKDTPQKADQPKDTIDKPDKTDK